jgi:SAM-dependent methyltransferase
MDKRDLTTPDSSRQLAKSTVAFASRAACQDVPPHSSSRKWEQFAQDDPYTYILTSLKASHPEEFWRSGERTTEAEILPLLELYDLRPRLALELGCGLGRLTIPLAGRFEHIVGVDIAQSMVQCAKSLALGKGLSNVSFKAITGPEDLLRYMSRHAACCDFIYSLLVFQHISEFWMIQGYLEAIRVLLHGQGVAYVQFDTRSKTAAYRLKTALPDFLLPRFWRRGIRRIRRSTDEIEAAIRCAGLEILAELSPRSAYHRYILRPSRRRSDAT